MKIVVGLGNPEKKYDSTYHNIGFMALDELAERLGASVKKKKCSSLVGEAELGGTKLVLAKPLTYMNLSGQAVLALMASYKVKLEDVVVLVDDFDLAIGDFRFREKGSAGTHNGLRSIAEAVGSNFKRLRIGIRPASRPEDLADYVLSKIGEQDSSLIASAIDKGIDFLIEKVL